MDATLSKSFGLPTMPVHGENANLEFRTNFYNLSNKLNLWNLQTYIAACGSSPCNGHLGKVQQALGARVIECKRVLPSQSERRRLQDAPSAFRAKTCLPTGSAA